MPDPDFSARRIFLLRHAHSGWPLPGMKDFDRPLDDRGRSEAEYVARLALEAGFNPHKIRCSPAARCVETVAIFTTAMKNAPAVTYDRELYGSGVDYYLSLVEKIEPGESLLIAGHNPMIEDSFSALCGDDADAGRWLSEGYPTAGLAAFSKTPDGLWRVEKLLTP